MLSLDILCFLSNEESEDSIIHAVDPRTLSKMEPLYPSSLHLYYLKLTNRCENGRAGGKPPGEEKDDLERKKG